MQSLLGQFYNRINGSQEDIASEGLSYILSRSKGAREAIKKIIKSDCDIDLPDLIYSTQNSGDKLERPDISGFDANGNERLIIEAKFWAALTENQPIGYLKRLKGKSVLIFICPELRVRPVCDEITRRLKTASIKFVSKNDRPLFKLPNNQQIIVKTWDQILGAVRLHLAQENNQNLLSDIDQIIGFCETIDNETFLPILCDDLSPKIAKRINSYYDLVDKVIDELIKREKVDLTGMKATPQKYGYTRYCKINNYGVSINLKLDAWAKEADTPFWISFKDDIKTYGWSMTNEFKLKIKKIAFKLGYTIYTDNYDGIYFALRPLVGQTEDNVVHDLTEKIILLSETLQKN